MSICIQYFSLKQGCHKECCSLILSRISHFSMPRCNKKLLNNINARNTTCFSHLHNCFLRAHIMVSIPAPKISCYCDIQKQRFLSLALRTILIGYWILYLDRSQCYTAISISQNPLSFTSDLCISLYRNCISN